VLGHVTRRLAVAAALAFGVATLTFALLWLAPGDSRGTLLLSGFGDGPTAPATAEADGALESYGRWVGRLIRGDLGYSETQNRPVARVLGDALPHTLALSSLGLLLAAVFGVATGVFQAARAGSRADRALAVLTVVLYSAPSFWVGLLLIRLFVGGPLDRGPFSNLQMSGVSPPGGATGWTDYVPYLVLPALTLGLVLGAGVARFTRAHMVEILDEEYIRAARGRGVGELRILFRHALRAALLPLISLLGIYLPMLLTGAVFVETVFERTGVGWEMVRSIQRQDIPVVAGGALLFGFVTVAANLLADLLYAWADPRIGDARRG
jgi:peptide/nickel transport system permease protein